MAFGHLGLLYPLGWGLSEIFDGLSSGFEFRCDQSSKIN